MNGEDGDVMVRVVANPSGHVTSVEMRGGRVRTGSTWRWWRCSAMRTCRRCWVNEPITFDFTMHYILIRMR